MDERLSSDLVDFCKQSDVYGPPRLTDPFECMEQLENGLQKFSVPIYPQIDMPTFARAYDQVLEMMCEVWGECRTQPFQRFLQPDEVSGQKFMPDNTSAGYVWSQHGQTDKGEALAWGRDLLVWYWNALGEPGTCYPLPVWKTSLKDEVRKRGKDARVFMAGPLEHHCVSMAFSFEQNAVFYGGYGRFNGLGTVRQHGGWNSFAGRIWRRCGFDRCFAQDAKGYDASLLAFLLLAAASIRFQSLLRSDPDFASDKRQWRRFWRNVESGIYSLLVTPDGYLLLKQRGNASGKFDTTVDNTLVAILVQTYSWLRARPDTTLVEMERSLVLVLYGDDVAGAMAFDSDYSVADMQRGYRECGITLAGEHGLVHLSSMDFLGFSFVSSEVLKDGRGMIVPARLDGEMKTREALVYTTRSGHSKEAYLETLARLEGTLEVAFTDVALFNLLRREVRALRRMITDVFGVKLPPPLSANVLYSVVTGFDPPRLWHYPVEAGDRRIHGPPPDYAIVGGVLKGPAAQKEPVYRLLESYWNAEENHNVKNCKGEG